MRNITPEDDALYTESLKTATPEFGLWSTFSSAFSQGFQENVTGTVADIMTTVGQDMGIALGLTEDTKLKGEDANKIYGLEGDKAFPAGEEVSSFYAAMVGERDKQVRENEANLQMATTAESGHSIMNFVGNLAGGMADPIGIWAGNAVGSKVLGKLAENSKLITKGINKFGALGEDLLESAIGAAIIDAPAYAAHSQLYREEFEFNEYVMMVASNGILGAALPASFRALTGKTILGHVRGSYGDNATDLLQKMHELKAYEKRSGIPVKTEELLTQRDFELHTVRPHQSAYTFNRIDTTEKLQTTKFYGAHKINEAKLWQDSKMGGGAFFFSDNANLMENSVNSLDGLTKGNVVEIDVSKAKISGPENLSNITDKIVGEFNLRKDVLGEYSNVHELLVALNRVLPDNTDANYVFNKAVLSLGFDGYHADGLNLKGEVSHNGLVLLDKRAFGVKTESKFANFTQDGVQFDESIVSPGSRSIPPTPLDSESNFMREMKEQQQSSAQRLLTPEPESDIPLDGSAVVDDATIDTALKSEVLTELDADIQDKISSLSAEEQAVYKKAIESISDPEALDKFSDAVRTCLYGG